jgi:uncharacterized protein YkwD
LPRSAATFPAPALPRPAATLPAPTLPRRAATLHPAGVLLTLILFAWSGLSCAAAQAPSRSPEDTPRTGPVADRPRVELEVLDRLNWARAYPDSLADHLEMLRPHFQGRILAVPGEPRLSTQEGVAAVDEAIRVLRRLEGRPPLALSRGLSRAAAELAEYQGPRGEIGHLGRGGSTPSDRADRHGAWQVSLSEAISYGPANGLDIITTLMVDDGVANRGHRESLLDPRFRVAGIALGPHSRLRYLCVIDLAVGFEEKGSDLR